MSINKKKTNKRKYRKKSVKRYSKPKRTLKKKIKNKTKRKYSKKKQKMKGGVEELLKLNDHISFHGQMGKAFTLRYRHFDPTKAATRVSPVLNQKNVVPLGQGEIIWASSGPVTTEALHNSDSAVSAKANQELSEFLDNTTFRTNEEAMTMIRQGSSSEYDNAIGVWEIHGNFVILMRPMGEKNGIMLTQDQRTEGKLWRIEISNQRDIQPPRAPGQSLPPRILYSVINVGGVRHESGKWRTNLPLELVSIKDMKPNADEFLIRECGFCYVDMGPDTQFGFDQDLLKELGRKWSGLPGWGGQWGQLIETIKDRKPGTEERKEAKILFLSILSLVKKIFSPHPISNLNISYGSTVGRGWDSRSGEIYYKCTLDFNDGTNSHEQTEVRVKFISQGFRSQDARVVGSQVFPSLHTDFGKLHRTDLVVEESPEELEASMDPNLLEMVGYCLINLWVNLTPDPVALYSNSLALMDKRSVNEKTDTDTWNEKNHTMISNVDMDRIYTYDGLQYGAGFFFQSRFVPHSSLTHTTDDLRLIGTKIKERKNNLGESLRPSELYLNNLNKTVDLSDLSKYEENLADLNKEEQLIYEGVPHEQAAIEKSNAMGEEIAFERAVLTARGLTHAKATRAARTIEKKYQAHTQAAEALKYIAGQDETWKAVEGEDYLSSLPKTLTENMKFMREAREQLVQRGGAESGYDASHDIARQSAEIRLGVKIIDPVLHDKYIGGHHFHDRVGREKVNPEKEDLLQADLVVTRGVLHETPAPSGMKMSEKYNRLLNLGAKTISKQYITSLKLINDEVDVDGYRYYNIDVRSTDTRGDKYVWKISKKYSELEEFNREIIKYNSLLTRGRPPNVELSGLVFPPTFWLSDRFTKTNKLVDRFRALEDYLSGLSEIIPQMADFPWETSWGVGPGTVVFKDLT